MISKPISLYGILAFVVIGFSSCQKSEVNPAGKLNGSNSSARKLVARLPEIKIYDDKTKKIFRVNEDGFSFIDNSGSGFNFSDPTGVTYTDNTTGGELVVAAQGFGSNSGGGGAGGLIQIGSTSLNIKYTFCFSADEKFFGANLFSTSSDSGLFSGVSGVIGVDGDFTALQSGSSTNKPEDLFKGLGMYIVYDKKAQGTYPIVNWLDEMEDSDTNPADFKKKGFAFFMDFQNEKISFSKSGNISVSGGSMTFTGQYLTIHKDADNDNYVTENGLGTLGCN